MSSYYYLALIEACKLNKIKIQTKNLMVDNKVNKLNS